MEPAPDAQLIDQQGRPVRLSSLWAAGPVFLVFYPGDQTPVCTAQLCSYRDRWDDFRELGVQVVGINPAASDSKQRFAERHRFPFPLLADPGAVCCKAYGAQAWYGTRRLAVLVDQEGRIRWRSLVLPFLRQKPETLLAAAKAALGR